MNSTDNYILINYKHLAEELAIRQFYLEHEQHLKWNEIYEQTDDSGNWYLKSPYDSIMAALIEEWESTLLDFDIINSI